MANSYPTSPRSAFLSWCQDHVDTFANNFAQIGLTSAQAIEFAGAISTLAADITAQGEAEQAKFAATVQVNSSLAAAKTTAGDTIRLIRAYAESQPDPDAIYAIAQIAPIAPPSPQAPPAQPTNIVGMLDTTTGALRLSWKATNPGTGTSYTIKRRLEGESDFTFLGNSGVKSFTDDTLPAGVESAQYTIQGQRADSTGPVSPIFTATFGRVSESQSGSGEGLSLAA